MGHFEFQNGGNKLVIDQHGVELSKSGILGLTKHRFTWSEIEKVLEVTVFGRYSNVGGSEYFPGDQVPLTGTKLNEYLLIDTARGSFKIYSSDLAPSVYSGAEEHGYEELRVILKHMVPDKVQLRGYVLRSGGPEMVDTTLSLGRFFQQVGNLAAAEELYRKAFYWAMHYHNENHPLVADALLGVSSVLRESGRASEAEPLEARAMAIRSAPKADKSLLGQIGSIFKADNEEVNKFKELRANPEYQKKSFWEKVQAESQNLEKLKREREKKKHI